MEQTIDIPAPGPKVYRDKAIWAGAFLGGPLAAGYLIAENYRAFNQAGHAKKTWLYTIIGTVVLFGGLFMIPDTVKLPGQVIPLIYTVAAYVFVQHYQGPAIAVHLDAGGQVHPWWRTVGVGVAGLVITGGFLLGFAFLSDAVANAEVATRTYGIMRHEIAYDKNNLTQTEADRLAEGLTTTAFFDGAVTKYVYVEKVDQDYELSMPVVEGTADDPGALEPFIELREEMQALFPGHTIRFKLVVDQLDNVVKRIE
jgi:hypothetical protein